MGPWLDFIFAKVICRANKDYYTVSVGLWSMLDREYIYSWFNCFACLLYTSLALSSFYRTSLNKGKNVMSIKDEIDNMRSYLTIQQMMHDGDFDAVVDIEDGILQYNTLNLILQPLIENAIDHGIDLNTGVRGVITITGRGTEDEIILTVEDNGVGMTKEQADKIKMCIRDRGKEDAYEYFQGRFLLI